MMCLSAIATTVAPPAKLDTLNGAWIGPDDSIAYLRLEISKKGTGLLAVQWDSSDPAVSLYLVRRTVLARYDISFALEPLQGADPISLSGMTSPGELNLVVGGINHGTKWHNKAVLEREDYLLPRINAVKTASALYTSH
jgi:hypothetical protein